MPDFLDGAACCTAVKRLLSEGGPVYAAVAYWGAAAIENLGIAAGMDLTVICDASSGCNIDELKTLIALLGTNRVLTHDRLHAKEWIGQDMAIVGSSNASANGLGYEGCEVASLLEANLMIRDKETVSALRSLIETTVIPAARRIKADDMRVGARRQAPNRETRPSPEVREASTALGAVQLAPT